ncbi:MAG: DUF2845 domain-containing protein [Thermodesulfobacteriota bacterium]
MGQLQQPRARRRGVRGGVLARVLTRDRALRPGLTGASRGVVGAAAFALCPRVHGVRPAGSLPRNPPHPSVPHLQPAAPTLVPAREARVRSLRLVRAAGAAVLSLLRSCGSVAAGLSCGRSVVMPGDSAREVLAKCGSPSRRQLLEGKPRKGGKGRRAGARREVWVYDLGPRQLVRCLTFERGRLRATELDGYGR